MSELLAAVVSITRTQRGRYFWAAWWTAPPERHPFRKPDAANGGASTPEEAKREAEKAAGGALAEIEPRWARACVRSMRGQPPFSPAELTAAAAPGASHGVLPRRPAIATSLSLWDVLGVDSKASVLEIKRAFRKRALETHPDHGGDPAAFRTLHQAYERAIIRREKDAKRPKKKH